MNFSVLLKAEILATFGGAGNFGDELVSAGTYASMHLLHECIHSVCRVSCAMIAM